MNRKLFAFAFFLTSWCAAFPQAIVRPRGSNTFGIAAEFGGTMDPVDNHQSSQLTRAAEDGKKALGFSGFYEHAFNFGPHSSLKLGAGLNATFFSNSAYLLNNETRTRLDSITFFYGPERSLGTVGSSFYAIDLPVTYAFTFNAAPDLAVSLYAGVKFRNVTYIADEQRNTYITASKNEVSDGDTVSSISYRVRGGTKASRLIVQPVVGVQLSHPLANGGSLNLFADLNFQLFNNVELRYGNIKNRSDVYWDQYSIDTGEMTPYQYGRRDIEYRPDFELIFALNMAHLRTGISYTLPSRQ
jgi:hypothetical protein